MNRQNVDDVLPSLSLTTIRVSCSFGAFVVAISCHTPRQAIGHVEFASARIAHRAAGRSAR